MPKVKIYTTSTCGYCFMAKDFLNKNNIEFEAVDVGLDQTARQEMMDRSGQMGVPVLDIDGNIIIGFDKPAIVKALGLS
ncbi:MAG: glutaredoxin domain-containing protein [Candidatus Omnitrophota bacterium]